MMEITIHTKQRYRERVDPSASLGDAERAIRAAEWAVTAAAEFRCRIVRLGNGAKLVLKRDVVVTVLPRERAPYAGHSPARVAL